jgi:hypothetical protein
MTNQELLSIRPALQIAASGAPEGHDVDYLGAQTTAMRYALMQNQKRLQETLEVYQEMLQELLEEHDIELDGGGIPEDAPEEFEQELQELLQQEAPFQPYTISDTEIKKEPGVPLQLLVALDWMIDDA